MWDRSALVPRASSLKRTAPLSTEEINKLLKDVAEIKILLFCRLLLSQASVLPAAYRANSVREFLEDESVSTTDLRDLCLKMEKASLSDIRDACADLAHCDEVDDDDNESSDVDEATEGQQPDKQRELFPKKSRPGDLPDIWISKKEKQMQEQKALRERLTRGDTEALKEAVGAFQGAYIDFGEVDDQGQFRVKKIRIKICGRYIWNYPSEKSMKRGGWLQFSVMAKDSDLAAAIRLCRSWDEFFELNILAIHGYFPSARWISFFFSDNIKMELFHLVRSVRSPPELALTYLGIRYVLLFPCCARVVIIFPNWQQRSWYPMAFYSRGEK